jgi:hypothetical protein
MESNQNQYSDPTLPTSEPVPPAPTEQPTSTPESPKSRKGLIIGLIIEGIVLLAVVTVLLVLLLNNKADDVDDTKDINSTTYDIKELQARQRDDYRKRDVSNVVQAVVNSIANRNAQLVSLSDADSLAYDSAAKKDDKTGLGEYLGAPSSNIDYVRVLAGTTHTFAANKPQTSATATTVLADNTTPFTNAIYVYTSARCVDNTGIETASARSVAVVVQIENNDNDKYYCQDAN